ncbi:MAG: S8 family serine peptidase, partial [Actinobacteria bacterium]|nr:S8 family serine peptidase [Actinomycetota bacterium]
MRIPFQGTNSRATRYQVTGAIVVGVLVAGLMATSGPQSTGTPVSANVPFLDSAPLEAGEEDVLGGVAAASARHRADRQDPIPLSAEPDTIREAPFVPGQLLVGFKPSASRAARREALDEIGGRILHGTDLPDIELVDLGAHKNIEKAQAKLEKQGAVGYAEPNHIYSASASFPSDKSFPNQWAFDNTGQTIGSSTGTSDADIDAPEAWDSSTGGEVTVAVIDSGVAFDHPDLSTNLWSNPGEAGAKATNGIDDDNNGFVDDNLGWDFVQNDNRPLDQNGHGTHVAGTIGAQGNNGVGVAGAAWDVRLMSVRALGPQGDGTTTEIIAAIRYAVSNGADIINLSLGGPGSSQTFGQAIADSPQTLFVVAAGNEGANNDTTPSYPCNYTSLNIICVAATTQTDALASFSNYGATRVDLGAPGTQIISTVPAFTQPFKDTFTTLANWTTGGSPLWGIGSEAGGTFAADSPGAPYVKGANSWIQLAQPINLQGARDCGLNYRLRLDAQSPTDGLEVEASADGST